MTWLQLSQEVDRILQVSASPVVLPSEMPGLLNDTYDEKLNEWVDLSFELNESAIRILAPLKRGPITPTLTGGVFWIDGVVFPGGVRRITSFRGLFTQSCSSTPEWRNINFLSDQHTDDLENPLRKPTNDFPKYRLWWDSSFQKEKITIVSDSAPSTVNVFYVTNPVLVTEALVGSPEVSIEGQWQIIRRAVAKQSGITEDVRHAPAFQPDTAKDTQVSLT